MAKQADTPVKDPFASIEIGDLVQFPPPPLIRFEGWRIFVGTLPAVPPAMPSLDKFHAMTEEEKADFAKARKRYHSKFGPIHTPTLTRIVDDAIDLALSNTKSNPGARPGMVLDGDGTLGKSTIAVELGKKYENLLRKKLNWPIGAKVGIDFVPVVYVTLPGELTIKAFNRLIAQFLGIPGAASGDINWLNERIIDTAIQCRVSLIIIDDIHFLKMKNRSAESINNHFKFLANCINATFIYAGINVDDTGLLSEGSSKEKEKFSQTRHRFKKYSISPFKKGSKDFLKLLLSFEKHLLVLRQKEKGILALADYIHDRTDGYIGAISNLLREGANMAIRTKDECLSEKVLNLIRLDHAAEQHRKIVRPARPEAKTASATAKGKPAAKKETAGVGDTNAADPFSAAPSAGTT